MKKLILLTTIFLVFLFPTIANAACSDFHLDVTYLNKTQSGCYDGLSFTLNRDSCINACFSEFSEINFSTDAGQVWVWHIQGFQDKISNPAINTMQSINCSVKVPTKFIATMKTATETCELSISFENEFDTLQRKNECYENDGHWDDALKRCDITEDEEVITSKNIKEEASKPSVGSSGGGFLPETSNNTVITKTESSSPVLDGNATYFPENTRFDGNLSNTPNIITNKSEKVSKPISFPSGRAIIFTLILLVVFAVIGVFIHHTIFRKKEKKRKR